MIVSRERTGCHLPDGADGSGVAAPRRPAPAAGPDHSLASRLGPGLAIRGYCYYYSPIHAYGAAAGKPGPKRRGFLLSDEPAGLTVFTIGHSNGSDGQFLALLARHAIEMVVDVRGAPYSRFTPHFNRENPRLLLKEAGLHDAYAGEKLEGRPADPGCYRGGVPPEPGADYLLEVDYVAVERRDWYQSGIRRPRELAAARRTAVMCSEENPHACHRHHLIGRTLLNQGVEVLHIRHGGELTPGTVTLQQTGLFAAPRTDGQ